MAYVLHRTPCCRSKWELKHGKGGGEKKDPFFMKITYLGDGENPVNFLLKKVNAFGNTYDLDESSINKMTLDGTEIKFEDLTLANKGEYGGTTDIYTYVFNDTNEHELIIYSNSLKMLRFTGLTGGPGGSNKVRFNNIKSVDINNVTSIDDYTFYYCRNLVNVSISNSVTNIKNLAFLGCSSLTSINIPNSVTNIGSLAFAECTSLTSITIPNSMTSINNSVFQNCTNLASITVPNSVTNIGGSAFGNTLWINNQPDGVVYAGNVVYQYKGTMPSNTSITLREGTLGIAGHAFYRCTSLTSVTIPNSVTSIGDGAFSGCTSLTSVTIGNRVTSIGGYAFQNCSSLTSVTIPNSVTSIGVCVFYDCTSLTSITSLATTAPTIQSSTFRNVNTNGTLTVPSGSTGYDVWMSTDNFYLGGYNWTKVEQ